MLVGRSGKCDLQLAHPSVSGEHAVIWWSGDQWRVRDLDSRNGTQVDDQALQPSQPAVLREGTTLRFGQHPLAWTVASVRAPTPRAVDLHGRVVEAQDGVLILPDPEQAEALLYPGTSDSWILEEGDEARTVQDLDLVRVGDDTWRLHLPLSLDLTMDEGLGASLSALSLDFLVSADEEHVRLVAEGPGGRLDLGSRAHHYTLLTLARARLRDARDPSLPTRRTAGWPRRTWRTCSGWAAPS